MAKYAAKSPELTQKVLRRIASGETLASLGRKLNFTPAVWYNWVERDAELEVAYARAREVGHDALADGLLEIADEVATRSEDIQKAKLRIETRLKLLACWNPRKYGNKQTVDVGNKDGEALKVESNVDTVAAAVAAAAALRDAKRDA